MSRPLPYVRLLPVTMATMLLLLVVKTVSFARDATGGPAASAAAAAAASGSAAPASAPASAATQVVAAADPVTPPPGAPAHAAAPAGRPATVLMPDMPPVSSAERSLLLDLRKRRQELDARSAMLDEREAVQAAAEAKLSARVDQLAALQARLEALEAERQKHASEDWTGLVHVYEAMKPRDAATIFNALDMQVLLQVLDRMQDRKAAPVLAAMEPDRARLATQLLAEMRLRAVAAPGQPSASHPTDQHS